MGAPYKKVAFHTFGCKLNFAETSMLSQSVIDGGYRMVNHENSADVYVLNSCSVTENADKKTHKFINRVRRTNPFSKVIIVGCYAQLKPQKLAKIPGVYMVLGHEYKFNLVDYISKIFHHEKPIIKHSKVSEIAEFKSSFSLGERTRSFLKVQDGCDYNCSFCTIPLARGESRSGTIIDIIKQANLIASKNVKEIVLTGVNIGDFGVKNNESFYDLIKELEKINNIERFRISSIEPNLLSEKIVEFVARSKKFLPHFHIPLQSGSPSILNKMRRRYKLSLFNQRLSMIKKNIPDASIGIDVIVGFPGETEYKFNETLSFLKEADFSYLHVFSYSERANTDAKEYDKKINSTVILERSKKLRNLSLKKTNSFYKKNLGSIRKVLIESHDRGTLFGLSENYVKVKTKGFKKEINTIMDLKISAIDGNQMEGNRV